MCSGPIPEATRPSVAEFVATCLRLNRPDFSVFVDFHGHVNGLWIRYHSGGWARSRDPDRSWSIELDGPSARRDLAAARAALESASAEQARRYGRRSAAVPAATPAAGRPGAVAGDRREKRLAYMRAYYHRKKAERARVAQTEEEPCP